MKKIFTYGIVPSGLLAFTCGILFMPACKKDCKTSQCFDRKTMLTDIATQVALPAFADFKTHAEALVEQSQTFYNHTDEANLLLLQDRWRETAYAIKRTELFKTGPVNTGMYYPSIDFWPVRSNDVENYIGNNTLFTSYDLTSKGSTVKGSPVIEYLIFDRAQGNTAVLAKFTSAPDAGKRKDYLLALTQNLSMLANQLYGTWNSSYQFTFVTQDGTDIQSSSNSLVNDILALEDFVKGMKIGYPAGKKDGNLYPENVEAYQSGESIRFVKENLRVLEAAFTGGTGQGLDDYLNFVGAEDNGTLLSEKITAQFAVCHSKCDAVTLPLSDAVSQQPAAVTELYNELQKLLVYLKVDMVNNLGITITLNDNDGD